MPLSADMARHRIMFIMSNGMKLMFRYMAVVFAGLAALVSCGEPSDDDVEVVPDGVLKIFADKTSIAADGADCVTFRVMFGSEDVSTKNTMHLIREYEGKEVDMAAGANVFSTIAAGTYRFRAYLYSGGEHISENEIVVTAAAVEGQKEYVKKVLGEQYTSTGCTSCPALSANIKELQKEMPGILVPVSFHQDFSSVADPMAIQATAAFQKYHGFQGLPYFNLNFHKASGVETFLSTMKTAVEEELQTSPATCGVAIETSYDAESREVTVKSKVTSNVAARYKYHIFLVEDGLDHSQMGADLTYRHDNVVRRMPAPDVTGFNMNGKKKFTPGVEVTAENVLDVDESWKPENMRVVVAALLSQDGEKTWICVNANECKVGESIGYLTK